MPIVRPATVVKTGPAQVSGGGARHIIGAGVAIAQDSIVTGSGEPKVRHTGSGVAIAQNASVMASSAVIRTGQGLAQAQLARVSGTDGLPSALWEWDTPSLQDETDFYNNVLSLSIPANAQNWNGLYSWDDPPTWNINDPHNDNEGDDMWTWHEQLKRYGGSTVVRGSSTVQDWYDHALQWLKNNYLNALDNHETSRDYDHIYNQGLCQIYRETGDTEILPLLASFQTRIRGTDKMADLLARTPVAMAQFEGRQKGRWSICSAYGYETLRTSDWEELRDACVFGWETSTDWEEGGVIRNGGGLYMPSRGQFNFAPFPGGASSHDAGYRGHSAFQIGVMAEALWRLYVQTGSSILRDRLIKMARYVEYYAHNPDWLYPNCGSRFGHKPNGDRWFATHAASPIDPDILNDDPSDNDGGDGTADNAATNPAYDASLVNTAVIGYKLTGDENLLTKAQRLFERGNRWSESSAEGYPRLAPTVNDIYRYVDTQCNNGRKYFLFNKGVMQYGYMVYENGGQPAKVEYGGVIEGLASNLASGTWDEITSSMDNTNFKNITLFDGYAGIRRSALEYASDIFWNDNSKELHFRGGGASDNNAQTHIRFGDTRGIWDTVVPYHGNAVHQWGRQTQNPKTGDQYFMASSTEIEKWTYEDYPATQTEWATHDTPDFGFLAISNRCIVWFPEINNGDGGLVFVKANGTSWQLYKSDRNGQNFTSWTSIAASTGGGEQNAHYLPGQDYVVFGSGAADNELWKVDSAGTITKLNNTPAEWAAGANGGNGTIVGHPNGRVFLLGCNGDSNADTFHEWDEGTDQWSDLGTPPYNDPSHWLVATMIPEHDVIYVITQEDSGAGSPTHHWLYKL